MSHTITIQLPPLLDEIPVQYQVDVFPLLAMDDRSLQQETRQTFPADRWQAYETLLNQKKVAPLTDKEERQFTQLRREADVLLFRRSYAAVLLKRWGYMLPTLQELPDGQTILPGTRQGRISLASRLAAEQP